MGTYGTAEAVMLVSLVALALAALAVVAVVLARSGARNTAMVLAQVDEHRRVSHRAVRDLMDRLLAVAQPAAHSQQRQLSGEQEHYEESPVPEHYDGPQDKRLRRAGDVRNQLLRKKLDIAERALDEMNGKMGSVSTPADQAVWGSD